MLTSLVSLQQGNAKKETNEKSVKIVNIERENIFISSELLNEFQCNFLESCGLLKVTKKQGFTLSLESTSLEKL